MRIYLRLFSFITIPVMAVTILMFVTYQKKLIENAENELINELKNKWEIIYSSGILKLPQEEVRARLNDISKFAHLRITVMNNDGVVVNDSYVTIANLAAVENHKDRPEIIEAFQLGEGIEKRFSSTTGQRMLYYAKELKDNSGVMRIAYPMQYVESLKKNMEAQAYVTFAGLIAVLFTVLWFISIRISSPIIEINKVVEDIEKGRPPHFPSFKNEIMEKVAVLIYRTYNAIEKQKHMLESEKLKLSALVNLLEEGIIKLDDSGRVELANKKAEEILGCTLISGDDILQKVTDRDAIILAGEILSCPGDYTKVYELRHIVYEIYVRLMEGSKIIVLTDITDSERYRTYKSELITNISHELKTPLALVMGYAETVSEHPDMKKEDREKFLTKIYKGTMQLNQIINDVIELHRYESSAAGDVIADEELDVDDYAEELREYYSDKFTNDFRVRAEGEPIRINRGHLTSLVSNLVDNAIYYSGHDYIEVVVKTSETEFQLDVSDGGPAIPQGDRERIFERFYTVSKSRNKNHSSTGLGLSIVEHICRLYMGNITLFMNERGGNTFRVRIMQPERKGEEYNEAHV